MSWKCVFWELEPSAFSFGVRMDAVICLAFSEPQCSILQEGGEKEGRGSQQEAVSLHTVRCAATEALETTTLPTVIRTYVFIFLKKLSYFYPQVFFVVVADILKS